MAWALVPSSVPVPITFEFVGPGAAAVAMSPGAAKRAGDTAMVAAELGSAGLGVYVVVEPLLTKMSGSTVPVHVPAMAEPGSPFAAIPLAWSVFRLVASESATSLSWAWY